MQNTKHFLYALMLSDQDLVPKPTAERSQEEGGSGIQIKGAGFTATTEFRATAEESASLPPTLECRLFATSVELF